VKREATQFLIKDEAAFLEYLKENETPAKGER
jgi:hypothetical protein